MNKRPAAPAPSGATSPCEFFRHCAVTLAEPHFEPGKTYWVYHPNFGLCKVVMPHKPLPFDPDCHTPYSRPTARKHFKGKFGRKRFKRRRP